MGLLNPTTTTTTPAFETETSAGAVFAGASVAPATAAPAAAAAAIQPASTAVAVAASTELLIPSPAYAISEGMKDAIRVDFNTFPQITTTNGNFVERESKTVLGDTLTFELLSHQDSYVVDPGDEKAPKEMVRYSADGITCSDSTPVREHLEWLKASGYPKATVKQRSVVVGEIVTASKTPKYNGELVQFDLSPMSRVQWTRYLANTVNMLRKGRKTEDQLRVIKATTELATAGSNVYTKAIFNVAD